MLFRSTTGPRRCPQNDILPDCNYEFEFVINGQVGEVRCIAWYVLRGYRQIDHWVSILLVDEVVRTRKVAREWWWTGGRDGYPSRITDMTSDRYYVHL